jgi:hypothetical protein
MNPYEDRMRAVELYIKLGKRAGATIRQLGYPTKNALKAWYRAYEGQRDLPRGYVRSKPKYRRSKGRRPLGTMNMGAGSPLRCGPLGIQLGSRWRRGLVNCILSQGRVSCASRSSPYVRPS